MFVAPASHAVEREVCPVCQVEVNMLPVVIAARLAGVSHRTLYRWIEEDRVHYRELGDGAVLVCEKSLGARGTFPGAPQLCE